ncbi:MAG: helix-turn-helix transcriptional regulator [Nocardioides sp.]
MAQEAQSEPSAGLLAPGMVRRIRRILDVSQRELAEELGVAQATVARWETGIVSPDLETVVYLADLAGLRLALVDADGAPVEPMADHALRDRAGRRFPAHLDGRDLGLVPIRFLHRGVYRDLFRRHLGTPPDHPPPGARRGC